MKTVFSSKGCRGELQPFVLAPVTGRIPGATPARETVTSVPARGPGGPGSKDAAGRRQAANGGGEGKAERHCDRDDEGEFE